MPPAWPIDAVNGDQISGGGGGSLAAVAGYPHLTVPMGQVKGLPVGLSFIGPKWSDANPVAGLCLRTGPWTDPRPDDDSQHRDESAASSAPRTGGQAVSLSAAIAATMARMRSTRIVLPGSWNQRIPTTTVPTAPMPPQTA